TNQYSISGTLSLTNAVASSAIITDGTNTTTVTVSAGATSVSYVLSGLTSDATIHTVTVSYASKTASLTYTAPASCSVAPPCLLGVVVTPGVCQSATNQYSITGSVSATNAIGTQVITITDGATSTTLTLNGDGPASFTLIGLNSDGLLHTVSASADNCGLASTTYTAPSSCTVGIALTVTPGVCQSATNQYSISGTLSLTNAVAGTATITDGANSTTVAVTAGATSVAYSLSGLSSGTDSHTVTVSYVGKTTSLTYSAPESCTVGLAISVNQPSPCDVNAGQYSIAGALSLTNAVNGIAVLTDGPISTTVAIIAGSGTVPYTILAIPSGAESRTVTVAYEGKTASAVYTAPIGCIVSDICSPIFAKVTPGLCATATNTYATTAVVVLTNPVAGTVTISTQGQSQTFVTAAAATASFTATFTNLISDGAIHSLTATLPGCPPASATYTAPASCQLPNLVLEKLVNKSKAQLGEVLTYTIVLTNTGKASATNVTVRDSTT
ncbi:hypothetical protein, partial [Spirosoma sp. 48-14]|uniref:hypothetical protein n=1 Tax=Spirosoma sp. 48-14 TaxID=1895854 RepID=UPI000AC0E657